MTVHEPTEHPAPEDDGAAPDTIASLPRPVSVRRLVRSMSEWAAGHGAPLHRCTSTLYVHLDAWGDPWLDDQPCGDWSGPIVQVTVPCGSSMEDVALAFTDALATAAVHENRRRHNA